MDLNVTPTLIGSLKEPCCAIQLLIVLAHGTSLGVKFSFRRAYGHPEKILTENKQHYAHFCLI